MHTSIAVQKADIRTVFDTSLSAIASARKDLVLSWHVGKPVLRRCEVLWGSAEQSYCQSHNGKEQPARVVPSRDRNTYVHAKCPPQSRTFLTILILVFSILNVDKGSLYFSKTPYYIPVACLNKDVDWSDIKQVSSGSTGYVITIRTISSYQGANRLRLRSKELQYIVAA